MLDAQLEGRIDSWAVRFTLHHFLHGLVSLTPVRSYVQNIGMDGSGTHTGKTDRYINYLSQSVEDPVLPPFVHMSKKIESRFSRVYRRSLVGRIGSKINRKLTK